MYEVLITVVRVSEVVSGLAPGRSRVARMHHVARRPGEHVAHHPA
jgi:hypothetical protein